MIRVEPYRPEWRDAFVALNREWLERYFVVEASDERVFGDPDAAIVAPGGAIWIAFDARDRAVGAIAMIAAAPGEYELAKMAVTAEAQGRGIGRRLVETAVAWARERGATSVFLLSNAKLAPALALYRSSGFRDEALREADTAAYDRCDVRMRLPLRGNESGARE